MILEQIATGGCQSYLVGCSDSSTAALIDPEISQIDHYLALAARDGLRIRYLIDTHTHADHFSATRQLALPVGRAGGDAPRECGALCRHADRRRRDGDARAAAFAGDPHPWPHRRLDVPADRRQLFTGDTLLIGATGRTDLPSGDPEALYDSLFKRLLRLDPSLKVFPAHDYKGRQSSTIGRRSPATRACRNATAPPSST
jgi:glyoxylase-like metal-dependent hydrolase (beta-lactamase superfamily II)